MPGRRSPTRRDAWPLPARLANRELARRVYRRTGVRLHDLGPMRAARREALLGLDLTDRRFGYPLEMVLSDLGKDIEPGSAVTAAQQVFLGNRAVAHH